LERNAGEADEVVVRGLSPQYNEVSIEGVPMSSTNYQDRSIDLSILSDNLVDGVEVSKTLRPDMDADALGGTVNMTLKTAMPGLRYNFWGNGGYTNEVKSYNNYKFVGSISDRFLNDKVGILLQGNIEEKQLPSDQLNAVYSSPSTSTSGQFVVNTNSATLTDNEVKRYREGLSLVLDYKSDLVDVKAFSIYDRKKDSTITQDYTTNFSSASFEDDIYINQTTTEQMTNSIQALFKLGGTELPVSLSYTKADQHMPNGQEFVFLENGGNVKVPPQSSLVYGSPYALIHYMGVMNPFLTGQSAGSYLNSIYESNPSLTDESYDAKFDWKIPFKFLDSFSGILSVGGKYHETTRTSDNTHVSYDLLYGGSGPRREFLTNTFPFLNGVDNSQQDGVPAYPFVDPAENPTNYLGFPAERTILGYPISPGFNVYQLNSMLNYMYPSMSSACYHDGVGDFNQDYNDKESSDAGYIMAELNIGSKLTIVPGVRYQQELTDISAYEILLNDNQPNGLVGQAPVLKDSKRDNVLWYPSVNLKYKATDNIQIVGAVYESVSLPSYNEITPMWEMAASGNGDFIASGNPLLKPSTAWNYDLGSSWHSNEIGLLSVDLFYKDISNLIYNMQNYYPFSPYPVIDAPSDLLSTRLPGPAYYGPSNNNTSYQGLSTSTNSGGIPMNDPANAYLRGIELSWQTNFWYLPGVLSGLVLDINASFMSSDQEYPSFRILSPKTGNKDTLQYVTVEGSLQNQPKAIYNVVLGWDFQGFSARISYQDQKTTLTSIDTRFGLENYYFGDVTLYDLSLKQQILDYLSIYANATNIDDHVDNYYFAHPSYVSSNKTVYPAGSLPTSEQTYGWTLQLGISFNY
jgi:TonB-dependent receptor